jgi:hypothetical protein
VCDRSVKQLLLAIISLLILATTANVYAGGPRLDWPEDSSDEGKDCWVEGYDVGFAGKYDKERADRCAQENDEYNRSWGYVCIDGGLTKLDCDQIKDNPTNLENESLKEENTTGCFNDGLEDGKAHRPFNKDRASACSEYGGQYRIAYQTGCESDSTEESCELIIEGEEWYCPDNPDSTSCVEFLQDASNKRPAESGSCAGMGDPSPFVICPQEADPERYCLNTNDPAFCKTIGDICDADGFVRPEYPYCKSD